MIKLALIGCGKWGKNYLNTSISEMNITVICDPRLAGIDYNIGATQDYTKIKDVDGVIIATPPDVHKRIACYFLEAGKPVLIEKPVTLSLSDAHDLFETAEANQTPVLVNNTHLFAPAFEALREEVRGWRGPLTIVSVGGNDGPHRSYSALFDWGPHDVSMCLALFNDYPDNIRILRGKSDGGEVYTILLSQGHNQARLTIGSGLTEKQRRFEVMNPIHKAEYNDLADNKLCIDGIIHPIDSTTPITQILLKFVECIKTGNSDWRFSYNMNLDIMGILEECRIELLAKHPDLRDKLNDSRV